jgi:hypothetical protein
VLGCGVQNLAKKLDSRAGLGAAPSGGLAPTLASVLQSHTPLFQLDIAECAMVHRKQEMTMGGGVECAPARRVLAKLALQYYRTTERGWVQHQEEGWHRPLQASCSHIIITEEHTAQANARCGQQLCAPSHREPGGRLAPALATVLHTTAATQHNNTL